MGNEEDQKLKEILESFPEGEDIPFDILREFHIETGRSEQRIANLKKYIPKNSIGVEIGVFWGHLSEQILKRCAPKTFYLVDPWDKLYPETFPNWKSYTIFGRLPSRLLREFSETLAGQNEAVELFHGFSEEFYKTLPNEHLDWAYIDGMHRYEHVIRDLYGALPKMKKTGVIMGDDYWAEDRFSDRGVNKAVAEFVADTRYKLVLEWPSQFVLLPPQN